MARLFSLSHRFSFTFSDKWSSFQRDGPHLSGWLADEQTKSEENYKKAEQQQDSETYRSNGLPAAAFHN